MGCIFISDMKWVQWVRFFQYRGHFCSCFSKPAKYFKGSYWVKKVDVNLDLECVGMSSIDVGDITGIAYNYSIYITFGLFLRSLNG